MIDISKHITMAEATHTSTSIKNEPTVAQIQAMQYLAQTVIEPLRNYIGAPIRVHSFFRCPAVNKKVGGASNSQHLTGEAIDISCSSLPDQVLFDYILANLPFDQLILEPSWVHVSLKKGNNRKQSLKATKIDGKMKYEKFPV